MSTARPVRAALVRVPPAAWLLLALALAVRGAVVALTGDFRPVADPADYDRWARSLAAGDGFPPSLALVPGPSAYRPPVYPLVLGALYAVSDGSWTFARLAQALLGTGTVALVGLVAWQVWGRRVALAALAVGAVYLPLALMGATFVSEVVLVPLVLGAVAVLLHARTVARPLRWAAVGGVLCGLAVLTRPNAAVLLAPLAVAAWRLPAPGPRAAAVLVAAAVLTVAPWTVRNALALGAVVPVSTQDGPTLAGTYNETARTFPGEPWVWVEWWRDARYAELARPENALPEAQLSARLRARALDYVAARPVSVAEVAHWNARRLVHLTGLDFVRVDAGGMGLPPGAGVAGAVVFWATALLALPGLLTRRARAAPGWLWAVPAVMGLSVLLVAYARFRAPIDPFVVLLAALALAAAGERAGLQRRAAAH